MNVPSKVLELYHMHVCLSISNLINLDEALSLNIIRIEWLITIEECLITQSLIKSQRCWREVNTRLCSLEVHVHSTYQVEGDNVDY